jgi:hypothetical protein
MAGTYVRCALLALALSAAAATARADESYDGLIKDAIVEYNAGRWAEARLLFARAHAVTPSARTFRGMGIADYELGNYVQAAQALEAALESRVKPLSDAQRKSAEQVVARARQYIGVFRLHAPRDARSLTVDGQRVTRPSDDMLSFDPGRHVVTIETEDGRLLERELVVQAGARGELRLEPVARDEPAPARDATTPAVRPNRSEKDAESALLWTWVGVGATGVFGAATVTFALLTTHANDEFVQLRAGCAESSCDEGAKDDAKARGQSYQLLTNIGLGVTAAAAAASVVLFLIESDAGETKSPTIAIGPGSVALQGRF